MNQYTKGEWKSRHPINNDYTIYMGEYGKGIIQVAMLFESSPNAEANARLISAAPDMYEALKTISAFYSETGYKNVIPSMIEAVRKINKAIAKAEGKEK